MNPANPEFSWALLRFHRMFPGFILTEKNKYFWVPIASWQKKPILFELAWTSCLLGGPRQKRMKKSIENFRSKESQQISQQKSYTPLKDHKELGDDVSQKKIGACGGLIIIFNNYKICAARSLRALRCGQPKGADSH